MHTDAKLHLSFKYTFPIFIMAAEERELDTWPIIESFFEEHGFFHHQLSTFNEFVRGIPDTIAKNKVVEVTIEDKSYRIEFGGVICQPPIHKEVSEEVIAITPKACQDRCISYLSKIYCDIEIETTNNTKKIHKHVHIGSIPVMVKSEICNLFKYVNDPVALAKMNEDVYDDGGYFIINGAAKIIACQQRTGSNKVYVFQNHKKPPRFELYAEIRSSSLTGAHSTNVKAGFLKNNLIHILVPYIEMAAIPLGVVFRALGATDEKNILEHILPPDGDPRILHILLPSLEHAYVYKTQEDALHYIGKRGKKFMNSNPKKKIVTSVPPEQIKADAISYAKHLLSTEFLPHLGTGEESFIKKRFFLGYMVSRLIQTRLGKIPLEDRDHYANKRIATAGTLLGHLFHNAFKRLRNEIASAIDRCIRVENPVNIISIIRSSTIRTIMCNAIANNNWGAKTKINGISQAYERFNYAAGVANARKFVTFISSEGGKVEKPRKLHNSHWMAVCPSETPEGEKCGLITNSAVTCLVSLGSDPQTIREFILGVMNIITFEDFSESPCEYLKLAKIFVNGDLIGMTEHPKEIVQELRSHRRRGGLNPEISIAFDYTSKEIRISTEPGRVYRPLLIVEKGEVLLQSQHITEITDGEWEDGAGSTWTKLLARGYIEFIDKAEEETTLISITPEEIAKMPQERQLRITHCELHPSLIFGIGASLIPFSNHNQAPRITYQSAMGKQAIGIPGTNYRHQTRGKFHVMDYPQKPLVSTKMSKIIGFDKLPAGQNAVVFVCPWYGYGQEDSIIMNQSSIDRGFMCITTYTGFEAKIRRDKGETFEVPLEDECSNYKGNPSKLNPETGIIKRGMKVEKGDVLIGKTIEINETQSIHRQKKRNLSIIYNHAWSGTVHLIQEGIDGQGYNYVRVVVSQSRPPVLGDKHSSRFGQKGTVGKTFRNDELPFTQEGITPDIILNPLALPSRMTIGMMVEMLVGRKICSTSALNSISVKEALDFEKGKPKGYKDGKKMVDTDYEKMEVTGDATPFGDFSLEKICDELRSLGYNQFSDEVVMNGRTGEEMKTLVFTGVCYYQRLKHMVIDKVHARSRGGRTRLTRQPVEGRKLGGGLRIGSMERDGILAHGAPYFAKDRLMEQSDETRIWVCEICGLQALEIIGPHPRRECQMCESNRVVQIRLPYGTKLLMQELGGMNVVARILPLEYGKPPE